MSLRSKPHRPPSLNPMSKRRILFVAEAFAFPSGGISVIYQHAATLAKNGFRASVALATRPERDFYGIDVPLTLHGGRLTVEPGDIWVIPEGFSTYVEALRQAPVRKLMFCQNQYYIPFPSNPGGGAHELGVDGFIASSHSVQQFFADVYGLTDIPIIPCAVDPQRFKPAPNKKLQVACMPRKLGDYAAFVQATLRRMHPRHADVPWVAIQGGTQQEAAASLGESAVFLSLSHKESFGLPPLEAMAAGCLVAGFHGDGGREYMGDANGWWADTGDWRACVKGLAAALDLCKADPPASASIRQAMAATVARYSPSRMEEALLEFWRAEIERI